MTTSASIDFRLSEITAALVVGCVALMVLGLQPALLGDLIEQQRISLEGVGLVAMGEIFALGVGVVLAEKWLPLHRIRLVAVLSSLYLVAVNLLTLRVHGDLACTAMRVAAGLGEASLFWITTVVLVRSRQPDRLSGIFLTMQTMAQALVALMLARLTMPFLGGQKGFVALAVISALPLLLATRLPAKVPPHEEATKPAVATLRGFFSLLVPFAHLSAVGTIWAYFEPLEKAAGVAASQANLLVALVLVMQIAGGGMAAVAVRHWRAPRVVAASAVAFAAIGVLMHLLAGHSVLAFTALCVAFGFLWLFQMPFHYRLAFDVDPQGRIAMLVPAAQLLGSGFGPLAASFFVRGENVQVIPLIASGFASCALIAVILVASRVFQGTGRGRTSPCEQSSP
ncbi:MFS transporter [Dyella humicola]|uniref:MFS transporter n=1 Tax=Dyella humicola TaxID=2992126 RepID=UPI0022512D88|nr:MFS transporter [Dyella humicola]